MNFANGSTVSYDCRVNILATLARAAKDSSFRLRKAIRNPSSTIVELLQGLGVFRFHSRRQKILQMLLNADVFLEQIQKDMLGFGVCCFSRTLCNGLGDEERRPIEGVILVVVLLAVLEEG